MSFKFSKKFEFVSNFESILLFRKCRKISIFFLIFVKNFDLGQNFRKIPKLSYLLKFSKNFDFGQIFQNFDLVKFSKNLRFWSNFRKIYILVKIFEQFRFQSIFHQISILVKFSEKDRFS